MGRMGRLMVSSTGSPGRHTSANNVPSSTVVVHSPGSWTSNFETPQSSTAASHPEKPSSRRILQPIFPSLKKPETGRAIVHLPQYLLNLAELSDPDVQCGAVQRTEHLQRVAKPLRLQAELVKLSRRGIVAGQRRCRAKIAFRNLWEQQRGVFRGGLSRLPTRRFSLLHDFTRLRAARQRAE